LAEGGPSGLGDWRLAKRREGCLSRRFYCILRWNDGDIQTFPEVLNFREGEPQSSQKKTFQYVRIAMNQIVQTSQWNTTQILKTLESHRSKLQGWGVRKLGLFGSHRRGTAKPESDMDFLVEFESPSFDAYMDTKFFLEDLFQCKIDLVIESNIKPRLRPYILNEVVYVAGL
jgi:hypothetical protein